MYRKAGNEYFEEIAKHRKLSFEKNVAIPSEIFSARGHAYCKKMVSSFRLPSKIC